MAESETTILLAVFDEISSADHAVDMLWEWSESVKGAGLDAVGVLVNQHLRLDAQLIGDDSGYGEETGLSLDIFEILLSDEQSGNAFLDMDQPSVADSLVTLLALDEALIKRLRRELNTGHAILLMVPNSEDLEGTQKQLEDLGGQITVLEIPRATLFRAAALLDEEDLDDVFDDYDDDYDETGTEGTSFDDDDDEYDYDYYDDDEDYDDSSSENGRYR
jgi:hypothetical protein